MSKFISMAFRNLGRNRRRSILSAMALSMGLALLMFMAAFFKGEMRGSMESTLRLDSGHIQVRGADYDPDKLSVAWEYLTREPGAACSADRSAGAGRCSDPTPCSKWDRLYPG